MLRLGEPGWWLESHTLKLWKNLIWEALLLSREWGRCLNLPAGLKTFPKVAGETRHFVAEDPFQCLSVPTTPLQRGGTETSRGNREARWAWGGPPTPTKCAVFSATISPSIQHSPMSLGRVEQHYLSLPPPFYRWTASSLPEASKRDPSSSLLFCVV